MNIASFILPKEEVTYLRDCMTLKQGLEKLYRSGFTTLPVIDVEDRYVGVISEGDFLWNILYYNQKPENVTTEQLEKSTVRSIMRSGKVNPVLIGTAMETLLQQAKEQNFVPVIDDRSVFIGIIRRSEIIKFFADRGKSVSL